MLKKLNVAITGELCDGTYMTIEQMRKHCSIQFIYECIRDLLIAGDKNDKEGFEEVLSDLRKAILRK